MHLLRRRDLGHRDLGHHLVRDLELLQPTVHLDDNFHQLMEHQNRYVVDIAMVHLMHLQDVVMMDVLQNLDVLNLDEVLTFQDVVLRSLADVQVDVEPHHLLKMDCYLDVADEELRHQ
jgi:hypothetical protein